MSFNSDPPYLKLTISSLSALLLAVAGCGIERSPGSGPVPEGSLWVTAADTSGLEIRGAAVKIDGAERPERTPAYIHGIPEGVHEVVVEKFGFYGDTSSVEVVAGDTATVEAILGPIPPHLVGRLNFTTQPPGGRLLVGGRTFLEGGDTVRAPQMVALPWGIYRISARLEGFATASPLLPWVELVAGDTANVSFTLEPAESGLVPGALTPDFRLEGIAGDTITLSDLTGCVVLVDFWTVDCDPCKAEFPGIEAVYRQYAALDFRVLAVNPMISDDRTRVEAFAVEFGLTFQLLLDRGQLVTRSYNVNELPRNFLIDRSGRLHAARGGLTGGELEEMVVPLLNIGP